MHFLNYLIEELTMTHDIYHQNTTLYHPRTNALPKQVNQAIVCILKKTIEDHKCDWKFKLDVTLWAYHTTFKVTM
jgi:hypothetical protein